MLAGPNSVLRHCAPGDRDWVIVHENSEGEYSSNGGRTHRGLSKGVAIFARVGVTRIMQYAFALARRRPRKLLTVVTKSDAQRFGLVLWDEIAVEIAADFPDVSPDKILVDAMTVRMVAHPTSLDTIVATNLHADTGRLHMNSCSRACSIRSRLGEANSTRAVENRPRQRCWTGSNLICNRPDADILSDLAASLAGNVGIAPIANIDPERRLP